MSASPTSSLGFQNFFEATLSSDITASDTDIPLSAVPNHSEGIIVIGPDSASPEVVYFTSKTTLKVVCPSEADGRGQDGSTAAAWTQGTTVIIAPVGLHFTYLRNLFSTTPQGWSDTGDVPDTITYNGNRSYDLVFNSNDLTDTLSNGMKLKLTRTVSAPTYMGGLFNGSSHYFTKVTCTSTLSTVTNNFSIKATIEPTAYQVGYICGRSDSTPNNGFGLKMESDGRISVYVFNGGASNYRAIATYQSVELNKKTKIWASWTSGTVVIKINGVTVPTATAVTSGTAPTTAGTGGDFSIGRLGAYNSAYFPGYINDVGVFDAVITPATMLSLDGQALLGSETNCIGAWSLNNTGVNQQSAGTNDLTATGGVSYTVRSPYGNYLGGTLEYGIITAISFSTNTTLTVQVPEGCAIPTSGGVSAVAYSTNDTPYGFPKNDNQWEVLVILKTQQSTGSIASAATVTNIAGMFIDLPVSAGQLSFEIFGQMTASSIVNMKMRMGLSTSTTSYTDGELVCISTHIAPASVEVDSHLQRTKQLKIDTATKYYLNTQSDGIANTVQYYNGTVSVGVIRWLPKV